VANAGLEFKKRHCPFVLLLALAPSHSLLVPFHPHWSLLKFQMVPFGFRSSSPSQGISMIALRSVSSMVA